MSGDPERLGDFLAHILEAVERIQTYTKTWRNTTS